MVLVLVEVEVEVEAEVVVFFVDLLYVYQILVELMV